LSVRAVVPGRPATTGFDRPAASRRAARQEPSGYMDVCVRRADVLDHPRQHLGAVDEELDTRARSRRERRVLRPAARRRIERARVAAPAQRRR